MFSKSSFRVQLRKKTFDFKNLCVTLTLFLKRNLEREFSQCWTSNASIWVARFFWNLCCYLTSITPWVSMFVIWRSIESLSLSMTIRMSLASPPLSMKLLIFYKRESVSSSTLKFSPFYSSSNYMPEARLIDLPSFFSSPCSGESLPKLIWRVFATLLLTSTFF